MKKIDFLITLQKRYFKIFNGKICRKEELKRIGLLIQETMLEIEEKYGK